MVFPQSDLFQIQILVGIKGFCAKNQNITLQKFDVTAGDQNVISPLDEGYNNAGGKAQVSDFYAGPEIIGGQLELDETDIGFLGIFGKTLDLGVLLHESCRNNTGWDGNHTYAEEAYDNAEDLAQRRNRVNVAVSHGQQGGNRPPDAGESVDKHVRLGLVLQTVHAETGGDHQYRDDEYGREKLLAFADNDIGDDIKGVVIGGDAEQTEDADHSNHAESNDAGGEEERQIVGKERQ